MTPSGSSAGTAHVRDHQGQAPMLTDSTHWVCPRCQVQVYPATAQAGHRCVGYDAYLMHGVYPIGLVESGAAVGHDAVRHPPRAGRSRAARPKPYIPVPPDSSSPQEPPYPWCEPSCQADHTVRAGVAPPVWWPSDRVHPWWCRCGEPRA